MNATDNEVDYLFTERCRKLAGLIRLRQAVREGQPAEDLVQLDLEGAERILREGGLGVS